MNFWRRNIGDYAKKAGHLSMLEHGAYTLLLDRVYATESPIREADAYRMTRAASRAERDAVDAVLREFFTLTDDGWTNARALEEIALASAKSDANRENGKKGGRPPKAAKADKIPPCPQQDIIAAYHEALPELPPVNEWADASAENLRVRWRSKPEYRSLEWWRDLFAYIGRSDFLMGRKGDFQASLPWIVKASNFAKIVNGNYENRGRG